MALRNRNRGMRTGNESPSHPSVAILPDPLLRRLAILIALLAVLVRLWIAHTTHATGEDALIILRYAENIAHGLGFVYNPGERVLGSTTPLYTLLLALAALCHLDAESVGKGCNLLADGVTCLLIVRLLSHPEIGRPIAGLFAALLYALSSTPISISISGMETALVTCAGMAAITALLERNSRALWLLAALLFLLRIDTLALSGLLIGADLIRTRRLDWRDPALALAMILPWLVFAVLYFGSPIPTSLIAKLTVYRGSSGASRADILGAFAAQFTSGWFQRAVTLLFAVGITVVVHLAFAAVPVSAEGRPGDGGSTAMRPMRLLLAPLLWLLIYYGTMLTSHVPAFAWYFLPPWPLVLCFAALGGQNVLIALGTPIGKGPQGKAQSPPDRFLWVWMTALFVFGLFGLSHLRTVRTEIAGAQRLEDTVREPIGRWLRAHAGPKERILLEPIGTIGYYSQRPILDMIGLVSPEVFPSYRTATPLADIVRHFRPEWLCLRLREVDLLQRQSPAILANTYRLAEEFHAPGRPTAFRLYHRSAP